MLKIQFKDKSREPVWIVEKRYAIGSAPDNNLVIDDASISPLHVRLITENNKLLLKDNHSEHGCFVNDQRVTQKELLPGDELRLGNVVLVILDAQESIGPNTSAGTGNHEHSWTLVADSSWLVGQVFSIPDQPVIIGRSSQCDITLAGTHLSRQHAEISVQGNTLWIKDLGSANGTWLNDERITEAAARSGDRLRFDVYSFRLIGPDKAPEITRVRRSHKALLTQVERKTVDNTPKRWKTRPTSPGNRIETERHGNAKLFYWTGILLCLGIAAMLTYILLGVEAF